MLFNFAVAFWMFRVGQGGQRALPASERQGTRGDATPDDAWKIGGMFYFNPKDPALWVEQRIGIGYTLNMGNTSAWLLIGNHVRAAHRRTPVPVLIFSAMQRLDP
jgi:uncharacterized membrane protein